MRAVPSHSTTECMGTRPQQNHRTRSHPIGVVMRARRRACAHCVKPVVRAKDTSESMFDWSLFTQRLPSGRGRSCGKRYAVLCKTWTTSQPIVQRRSLQSGNVLAGVLRSGPGSIRGIANRNSVKIFPRCTKHVQRKSSLVAFVFVTLAGLHRFDVKASRYRKSSSHPCAS